MRRYPAVAKRNRIEASGDFAQQIDAVGTVLNTVPYGMQRDV